MESEDIGCRRTGSCQGVKWVIDNQLIIFTWSNGHKKKVPIPHHLTAEHYDFVFFFCDNDRDAVLNLKQWLEKTYNVTGIIYDDTVLSWIQSMYRRADEGIKRSTLMMCYISKDLDNLEDDYIGKCQELKDFNLHKDNILYKTVSEPSKCEMLIPVYTKKKKSFKKVPYGIGPLSGVELDSKYLDKHLRDLFDKNKQKKIIRQEGQECLLQSWIAEQIVLYDQDTKSVEPPQHLDLNKTTDSKKNPKKEAKDIPPAANVTNIFNFTNSSNIMIGDHNTMKMEKSGGTPDASSESEEEESHSGQRRPEMNDEAATENVDVTAACSQIGLIQQDCSDHDRDDPNLIKQALTMDPTQQPVTKGTEAISRSSTSGSHHGEVRGSQRQASEVQGATSGLTMQPSHDAGQKEYHSLHEDGTDADVVHGDMMGRLVRQDMNDHDINHETNLVKQAMAALNLDPSTTQRHDDVTASAQQIPDDVTASAQQISDVTVSAQQVTEAHSAEQRGNAGKYSSSYKVPLEGTEV